MQIRKARKLRSLFAATAFAAALLAGNAAAQVAGAGLTGTLTDPTGAAVAGASVRIEALDTKVARTVATGAAGVYQAQNLPPGSYQIVVTAAGFATESLRVELTVGEQEVADFRLRVGTSSEVVEVKDRNTSVELAESELGSTVGAATVRELPLNGRSWTDLANLQRGVTAITAVASYTAGPGRGNRGFGSQLSISGQRPQQNNYRLDGISINDYANGGPGSVAGGNLGVDAIQEFSVLTSNYSAEYGKTSGGVINAITRQGTDQFRGSAYEFVRNSVFDARNHFDPVGSIPSFRRNQFGLATGGPIVHRHTFLFGDYEGVREATGISNLIVVSSPNARMGLLVCKQAAAGGAQDPNCLTGAGGTQAPAGTSGVKQYPLDPNTAKYLNFYPYPNGTLSGDTATDTFRSKQVANEDFGTARFDQIFSPRDSMFATYKYDASNFSIPDNLNSVLVQNGTRAHVAVLEETHTLSPNLLNSFRLGLNRAVAINNGTSIAINPLAADTTIGAIPGQTAVQLSVSSIAAFGGGIGGAAAYFFHFTTGQLADDAFWTRKQHSMKFGVSFERIYSDILALTNGNGIFTYGTLSSFITNTPQQFQIGFANTLSPRDLRQNIFGGYFQDDWRATPRLTVNLGVRYEMSTVPIESHGKLSVLRTPTSTAPYLGDPYFYNPTYKNVEPRVGFNLDLTGKGASVVSGGVGLFDVLPLTYQFNLLSSLTAPFFGSAVLNNPPQGSMPGGATALAVATPSSAQAYIDPHPARNYVLQYNLNFQQALTPTTIFSAAFVGNRGVHQPFRSDDINIVLPTKTAAGYQWPGASGVLMNPGFGDIRGLFWRGASYYDGLQVNLTQHLARGLEANGAFTYSKTMDTSSSTIVGNAFANSINSPLWTDLELNRALADFDVRRVLAISATWTPPTLHSGFTTVEHLANGYEGGAIFKASDGIPFTAQMAGDPLGLKSTSTFAFPNRILSPACDRLVNPGNPLQYIRTQCFTAPNPLTLLGNERRNSLIGPGIETLDVFLLKNTPVPSVSERFAVQLRAEAFNILNRSNYSAPLVNKNVFDAKGNPIATAGLITLTTTSSRQLQFAIKFLW